MHDNLAVISDAADKEDGLKKALEGCTVTVNVYRYLTHQEARGVANQLRTAEAHTTVRIVSEQEGECT